MKKNCIAIVVEFDDKTTKKQAMFAAERLAEWVELRPLERKPVNVYVDSKYCDWQGR